MAEPVYFIDATESAEDLNVELRKVNYDPEAEEPETLDVTAYIGDEVECEYLEDKGTTVYQSNATEDEYELASFALTGSGNDTVIGTSSNDWINTHSGADVVFGGEGHDMISTEAGADVVVAGTLAAKKSSKTVEIAELSTEEEKVYATLGTVGSEIYAGADADVVYGSNGDDYIYGQSGDDKIYAGNGNDWIYAGKGNDTIDLAGTGDKTVFVYNEDANFEETILNANAGDKLQLAAQFGEEDFRGYSLENLTFNRVRTFDDEGNVIADDLRINTADAGEGLKNGTIVVDGFFESNAAIDAVDTLEAGEVKTNSIFKDATINVGLVDGETYNASQYNENISVVEGAATVTGLTAKDTIDFSTVTSANLTYNRIDNDLEIVDNTDNSITLKDYYKKPVAATLVYDGGTKDLTSIDSGDYTTVSLTSAWKNLTFARPNQGDDLTITDKSTKTVYTYENYFDTPFANVTTLDGALLFPHNIKAEATIYVADVNYFVGTDYNENITVGYGDADASIIYGGIGNDTLIGGNKVDELIGGAGNDVIFGGNGGEDVLMGDAGIDVIYAASGVDAKGNMTGVNKTGVRIYGGSGDDHLFGGKGDDTITGGLGSDVMYGNGGANTFKFSESTEYVNTTDTIVDATSKDTLEFTGMTVDTESEYTFARVEGTDDLRIRAIVSDEYDPYNKDVIIKDYFVTSTKNRIDKFIVDGVEDKLSNYVVNEVVISNATYPNGRYKGTDLNESIDAAEYISPNGKKGVTITTGAGRNGIIGSLFNDTITATKAAEVVVEETAGTNKITTGNGGDTVTINEGYSSNTINVGNGDNTVTINSYGKNKITAKNGDNIIELNAGDNTVTLGKSTELGNDITIANGVNKVTAGAGADIVEVTGGTNTIKLGNGGSEVTLDNDEPETKVSINNVTTGKDVDSFTITAGDNTIKSGNGADVFTISGGKNTITAGNGGKEDGVLVGNSFQINEGEAESYNIITSGSAADEFIIAAGTNIIKSGAGDDTFTITGGTNIIDGGAGTDTYDVSGYAGDTIVSITDKAGSSTLVLDDLVDVVFSITNVKSKTVIIDEEEVKVAKSFKIGKDLEFGDSVLFTGKDAYSVNEVRVGEDKYQITKANVNALAQEVANWLAEEGYASTADVTDPGAHEELMQVFADNSYLYYGDIA